MEDLKETAQIITLKQEMHMRVSCVKVPCFIGPTMAFVIITATTLPLEQTQWHKRHCFLKKWENSHWDDGSSTVAECEYSVGPSTHHNLEPFAF